MPTAAYSLVTSCFAAPCRMVRPVDSLPERHSAGSFATQFLTGVSPAPTNPAAPFQLHRAEDMVGRLQVPTPPHRTSFHHLLFLTHGHSERTRGLQLVPVVAHSVLLLPAGQITATTAISADVRGFFCLFEPTFLADFLPADTLLAELDFFLLGERPVLALPPDESQRLAALLAALQAEWQAAAPPPVLGALLYAVLLKIRLRYEREEAQPLAGHGPGQLTRRFLALLSRKGAHLPAVAAYADALAVTPNHLTRCVRRVTGRAASAWVSGTRVLEAQQLLRHSSLSVAEVADQLGFPDVSYFGRFFRQHTGLTPSQFRRPA